MPNATRICAALLLSLIAACQSAPRPSWDLPEDVKSLPVNGYPMAYFERGSGPTVVLVHGAFNDYRYWSPNFSSLSTQYRLVVPSLRHHYPERWNGKDGNYSLKIHAEDLAAFIEELRVGPVFLVAHSRGGSVALGAVRLRPDLVKRLVLMEPGVVALLPKRPGEAKPDPRPARAKATAASFEKGEIDGGLEFYIDNVFGPGSWKRRPESMRQYARDNAWTLVGMANDWDTVGCADLRMMRMPVLLMRSEKASPLFLNILNEAEKCLPTTVRVTIPNAGHPMNRDNPAAFERALLEFLER